MGCGPSKRAKESATPEAKPSSASAVHIALASETPCECLAHPPVVLVYLDFPRQNLGTIFVEQPHS